MANLMPYRPDDLFADLRREMDDAFNVWFRRPRGAAPEGAEPWFAPLDVHESEREFTVRVDAPGLTEKDLEVTCNGNVLTIAGERRQEKTEGRGQARYTERAWGRFSRSMTLPVNVAHDAIRARYSHGVLEVTVPKAPSAQQRAIKVET